MRGERQQEERVAERNHRAVKMQEKEPKDRETKHDVIRKQSRAVRRFCCWRRKKQAVSSSRKCREAVEITTRGSNDVMSTDIHERNVREPDARSSKKKQSVGISARTQEEAAIEEYHARKGRGWRNTVE